MTDQLTNRERNALVEALKHSEVCSVCAMDGWDCCEYGRKSKELIAAIEPVKKTVKS
jgi:hypothetical protein